MKKIKYLEAFFIVLSLFLIGYMAGSFFYEEPKTPQEEPLKGQFDVSYKKALDEISKDNLENNLKYLASQELEGRMSGKKGNVIAAEFIKNQFEKYGLKTIYQKFKIRRLNPGPNDEIGDDFTQNIYAFIEGNDSNLKKEIVVVGAHMDHIGYGPSMSRSKRSLKVHPGADDNASGTVALLEISKAFGKLKGNVRRTVVFMAFSAEEMGLLGSKFYCDNPLFPLEGPDLSSHVFMLNMDMIGYLKTGKHKTSFSDAGSSPDIESIIDNLSKDYNFANKVTGRRSGGSDHAPFYNEGIPVAFIHTGLHPYYHTPNDTYDKINYDGLEEITKYAFELSWAIANGERPKFNYGSFEKMDLTHDHGYEEFLGEQK